MNCVRNTPVWVWLVCAFFAALQPVIHALVLHCAPGGVVPTGLHKPDSAIFIHAMRMFETGFYSPYATCQSPFGDHSARLFTTPFYILYGIAGSLGSRVRIHDLAMLGIANGFGAACYLLAVYHFMRTILPGRANPAFALFAFSGGLGGLLYLACAAAGITDTPSFSVWFYRFAIYDLVEGPNLAPYLVMTRLYYTLPLAIGFAGLSSMIVSWRMQCRTHIVYSQVLLLIGALLNARLGPPLGAIGVLYLAHTRALRVRNILHLAIPLVTGVVVASQIMRINPGFVDNVYATVRQQMWPSSFVSAAFPLLLFVVPVVWRDTPALPRIFRATVCASLGYLLVFSLLFLLYQIYYGTLLAGADHAASVRVSDLSLVGAAAGLAWFMFAKSPRHRPAPDHDWIIVWAVVFVAIAISAFGQGWFLRFAPQRLMVFLGIPLSLLAAEFMARLGAARPSAARACAGLVIAAGLPALAVSTLVFQGPLGMRPGLASQIGMHAAYLRRDDAECLSALGAGVVAAPWPYNDILSMRDGTKVIGGYGAVGLSDQGSAKLVAAVQRFFTPSTPAGERDAFLRSWCVQYVYLPSDAKDRDSLASVFAAMPELTIVNSVGGAALFRVR